MRRFSFERLQRWHRTKFVPWLRDCYQELLQWLHRKNPVTWFKNRELHQVHSERPRFSSRVDSRSFFWAWIKVYWRKLARFKEQHLWQSYGADNTVDAYTSNDVRFKGKTLKERKILIVEREIDLQGMGRYQYWIWLLCASGYFLDLLWSQAISLIIVPVRNEFSFSTQDTTNLFAIWSAGLAVGAIAFGYLVDRIGRYWAFNLTVIISSVFGIAMGAANSYATLVALAFFNGLGIGGNLPIDTLICLEFLPQHRRDLLPLLSFFQPIGVIVSTGLAWALIPRQSCLNRYGGIPSCSGTSLNWPDCLPACSEVQPGEPCCEKADNRGWRNLMYIVGGISFGIFLVRFILFSFQESPKYLIVREKDVEAVNVVQWISNYNDNPTKLTMDYFHELNRADGDTDTPENASAEPTRGIRAMWNKVKPFFGLYRAMFTKGRARLSTVVLLIYAFDFWGFSITGSLVPVIIENKNKEAGLTLDDSYRDYMVIYAPGIGGVALGYLMYHVPGQGRRLGMGIAAIGYCVSLFLFIDMKTHAGYVGISTMQYVFQSMFNSILYSWTAEAFPSDIRGTASGLASGVGRLVSAFMPVVGGKVLDKYGNDPPLILAGAGVAVLSLLVIFGLPKQAFMPETNRGV